MVVIHTTRRGLVQPIATWLQIAYLCMLIDAALFDLKDLRGPRTRAAFWTGDIRHVRDQIALHELAIERWERRITSLQLS